MSPRVLACAACVACGRINFDSQTAADSGGTQDNSVGDTAASCASPTIDDTFTTAIPCMPWGTSFMNGNSALISGSGLVLQFSAVNSNAGCLTSSSVQPGSASASAEVAHAITGQDAYTALQFGDIDRMISVQNATLHLSTLNGATIYASMTYDPVAMRWWRVRAMTGAIAGDYSADGTTWTMLGMAPTTAAATRVVVMAGVLNTTSADQAQFTHFIVCP